MELLRDLLGLSVGARRVRPVRVALQNQRDTLPAFAGVADEKPASIAQAHAIAQPLVREACMLHRCPSRRPHTSRSGTGFKRQRAASSTCSSTP